MEEDCSYWKPTFIMLAVIKSIPHFLVCIAIVVRFLKVKEQASTQERKFSRLMKAKLSITFGAGLFYLLPIIFAFSVDKYWMNTDCIGTYSV